MAAEKITSLQNPRIKQLVKLRDRRPRDVAGVTRPRQTLNPPPRTSRLEPANIISARGANLSVSSR